MSLLERIYYFHDRVLEERYPNSSDLVDEFEISPATAHRDINYLRDRLLAPLAYSQKKNGYYYTDNDFRLPFEDTPRVVMLLGMLQKMAEEAGLDNLPELIKLQKKLASLVNKNNKPIENIVHCEWIETEHVDPQIFADVLHALLEENQLHITYSSPADKEKITERMIDPLKLVNYQGRWYIPAWCHLRQSRRMFHLSRISSAKRSSAKAKHQLNPDDDWLTGSFGIFKSSPEKRFQAKIMLQGKAAEIVRHQRWHPDQKISQVADGLVLELPVSDDRELIMKVLQFGSQARIIHPPKLCQKVQLEIEKMAELYKNDA